MFPSRGQRMLQMLNNANKEQPKIDEANKLTLEEPPTCIETENELFDITDMDIIEVDNIADYVINDDCLFDSRISQGDANIQICIQNPDHEINNNETDDNETDDNETDDNETYKETDNHEGGKQPVCNAEQGSDDETKDESYVPQYNSSDSDSDSVIQANFERGCLTEVEKDVDDPKSFEQRNTSGNTTEVETDSAGISVTGDDCTSNKIQARKRTRNPKKWARNVKKLKVNTGLSYTTETGNTVEATVLGKSCGNKCLQNCSKKITVDQRQCILDRFLKLGDITRKREYVHKRIKKIVPKYRYAKSTRAHNMAYYFELDDKEIRVCKTFFMSTLSVGNTMIRTILKKIDEHGILEDECRGKHGKQNRVSDTIRSTVRDHINKFARIESHYCRADNKREFIDGSLDLATMYREYVKYCTQLDIPPAKKHLYSTIFNTEFNIGFFRPKKDQCAQCAQYSNSSEAEKIILQPKWDVHIHEKELSRKEKAADVETAKLNNTTVVCCFDLQAVLPLPCGHISNFYYKRKLNVYNFTVYDIVQQKGYCFMWHEGVGKRGANEMGSCILKFLEDECVGKHVIFFSDNCVGQNKNRFITSMYLHAIAATGVLSITHKYLIVGHTQNEGDSVHSCIEAEKQRALRGGPIYVPSQLVTIAALAKKKGDPYQVRELDTSDFYDLKKLSQDMGKNYNVNDDGEKVHWQNIKIMRVEKESPNIVLYKESYEPETSYKSLNIRRKMRGRRESILLNKAYSIAPKILYEKKKDLLSLCESNLIPKPYHFFYESLQANNPHYQPGDQSGDEN